MLRSILCTFCTHFENCGNSQLFKLFLPVIQAVCTKVTRVYGYVQGKIYLFIIFLIVCLVANFKQPPSSD
jgi:hypothetical protein